MLKSHLRASGFALVVLSVFAATGCQTICGKGSATRFICNDSELSDADRPAREEQQRKEDAEKASREALARQRQREEQRAQAQAQEAEQLRIENSLKMRFCSKPDLFMNVFMGNVPVESNCIYTIGYAPLKVLQVLRRGLLAEPTSMQLNPMSKVIFIETNQAHVDGDFIQGIFLKSSGSLQYASTLGATRTVLAFKELQGH